ncbi:MAG: hypothetical protein CVV49_09745 [Spirochaetae bacterium HGW-Spirochaetae-5]|nr:MAG: hypothetical protein CVV49_09745 [Spirochaetae bacterium HGW-Spirochaetae-5]
MKMVTKTRNRIIILSCCILLNIHLPFSIKAQNPVEESFSFPADPVQEEWTYQRLENCIISTMIIRSDWAELPPDNNTIKGFYHAERKPVEFIGIHHDGSSNVTLKSILEYHVKTNGWGDIAYHFIIDKNGLIYEGRSIDRTSDTNYVSESYGKERLSSIVNILLLGNYDVEKVQTDSPQIESTKLLVSYLYLKYPLVTLDSIRGHRDFIADSESAKSLITCDRIDFH